MSDPILSRLDEALLSWQPPEVPAVGEDVRGVEHQEQPGEGRGKAAAEKQQQHNARPVKMHQPVHGEDA